MDPEGQIAGDGRWAGAGHSHDADSARAGREAVAGALAGQDPRLVLVFADSGHDPEPLMAAAREAAGDAQVIGCSVAAAIGSADGAGPGVAAFALGGAGFRAATAAAGVDDAAGTGLRAAGAEVAGCLDAVASSPHRALVVVTERRGGDPQEAVRGAYAVAGPSVKLAGGGAATSRRAEQAYVFDGEGLRSQAVVAAAIGSDAPIGIGVRHGWTPLAMPLLVTRSEREIVHTLNDRPALDAYLDVAAAPDEARADPEAFAGFAERHPVALPGRSGEPRPVFVAAADFGARTLRCDTGLPHGVLAWVLRGEPGAVLDAAGAACDEALTALGGRAPLGIVAFDCVARLGLLGADGSRAEQARMEAAAGTAALAGGYCYGQIARSHGSAGYHNHSLAVLALA